MRRSTFTAVRTKNIIKNESNSKLKFFYRLFKDIILLLLIFIYKIIGIPLLAGLVFLSSAVAQTLNVDISNTYLQNGAQNISGPPGTQLELTLNDSIKHIQTFPESGILTFYDALTGIDDDNVIVPSTKDFIYVHNTNLVFSPALSSKSKSQPKVKSVKVFNGIGQLIKNITDFQNHNGYITAHWEPRGEVEGKYFYQVETENNRVARGFMYDGNMSGNFIPGFVFDKMEKQKSENLEAIVNGKSDPKLQGLVKVEFKYTCDQDGPAEYQHEDTEFVEYVNVAPTGTTWFDVPTQQMTPLVQRKNADFQIVNGYNGTGVNGSSVRFLNGEHELISELSTDADGKFSIENLPTDSTFYVQVAHPVWRNMEYDFTVLPRTTYADTIAANPYFGITTVPDKTHYIAMFSEPGDYVGRQDGVDVNNPDLTMDRIMEGQIGTGLYDHDGQVLRDFVMQEPLACYNLTSLQEGYLDNFVKKILGGDSFNDYFSIADSQRNTTGYENYIDGAENLGINWEDTGNTTDPWINNFYNNYGNNFGFMVIGGNTESGGELNTYHELMNYMYPESVFSEESPANSTPGNVSINDALAVQYKMDVDRAKYKYGWFTGETGDLKREIPDF